MKRFVSYFLLLIATSLVLVACGGNSVVHKTTSLTAKRCPVGQSFMGCSINSGKGSPQGVYPPKRGGQPLKGPSGCKIPDVSSYQGHPAWATAKPYICGGIAKAGEYQQDPDFTYNWVTLRRLGLWHTAYWFIRNTGCAHEAAQYIAVLNSVGYKGDSLAGPPVLDMEAGEAYNYATCMANAIHRAFGVNPVIYTAPGTWPGGSADNLLAWPAAYGPSSPPCLPFTCSHYVAFQFAAPPYVYFYVPGLGNQDESVNYTFTSLRPFAKPVPARVHCFGPHASHSKTCKAVVHQVAVHASEVHHIRYVSAFRFKCLQHYRHAQHGHHVRWGVNYHRSFCVRLRHRVAADLSFIKAHSY